VFFVKKGNAKMKKLNDAYRSAYKEFHKEEPDEEPRWSMRAKNTDKGEIWRASDGWGERYFHVKKNGKVIHIANRMADVGAYYFNEPLKTFVESYGITRKTFKDKLGFGDSKWDSLMQRYLDGEKKVSKSEKDYRPSDRFAYKTNHPDPIYIPVNRIRTPYQTDAAIDKDKVKENIQKIKAGKPLDPVVIGYDYDLHDGHHRLEAAKELGHTHVPCVVGGVNERRVQAADKRYRQVWKSKIIVYRGRLLVKRRLSLTNRKTLEKASDSDSEGHWVTIRGRHVLINDKGDIVIGHFPFEPSNKKVKKLTHKEVREKISKGHLMSAHVGKTEEELLNRLKTDKKIRASSSFESIQIAEMVVQRTLNDPIQKKIEKWLRSSITKGLPLRYNGDKSKVIGYGVSRGETTFRKMHNAVIVLQKDGKGSYYVKTGYPVK
jgi:hypothetical protein